MDLLQPLPDAFLLGGSPSVAFYVQSLHGLPAHPSFTPSAFLNLQVKHVLGQGGRVLSRIEDLSGRCLVSVVDSSGGQSTVNPYGQGTPLWAVFWFTLCLPAFSLFLSTLARNGISRVTAPSGLLGRLLLRNWDSFLCLGAVFFFFAPMSLLPLAPHWGLGLTFFRVNSLTLGHAHLSIFVYYIFGSVGLAADLDFLSWIFYGFYFLLVPFFFLNTQGTLEGDGHLFSGFAICSPVLVALQFAIRWKRATLPIHVVPVAVPCQ